MKRRKKRNQRPGLIDDIGKLFPELKANLEQIQPPPAGPFSRGQLYPWLFSVSVTVLSIVLRIGKRLLQEVVDSYVDGLDRPESGASRPCPCGQCGGTVWHYNGKEKRKKEFLSIFGWVTLWRHQAECSRCSRTFYPLDEILGISKTAKLFPVLQRIVVFLGTHLPFREAAEVLRLTLGIHLSHETIRQVVGDVGAAVTLRHQLGFWRPELETLEQAALSEPGPFTLETALDGAMVPLNEKPKTDSNSHKEARSMSLRLKDRNGKVLAKFILSRLTELSAFLSAVGVLLDQCRYSLEEVKILLAGDGASWIWQFAKENGITRTVLDWFHLLEYYLALVEACDYGKTPGRRRRLRAIKDSLWNGRVEEALNELATLRCRNNAERDAKQALDTYVRNHRDHIINYRWNKQRKRTVGSGAVEGGQKKSIHDRMKCSGMRWSETGADLMMAARCSELNNTIEYDIRVANLAA